MWLLSNSHIYNSLNLLLIIYATKVRWKKDIPCRWITDIITLITDYESTGVFFHKSDFTVRIHNATNTMLAMRNSGEPMTK